MTRQDKSILIVENEVIISDDISRVVADMGHRPLLPAFGFIQAANLFMEFLPDLIILDIRLAGKKTGIDFANWLRAKHKTPIIYLTVFDDMVAKRRSEQTNLVAYIQKPFLEYELRDAIEKALN